MFSEFKVTKIYCMADDFYKEFACKQEKYMHVAIRLQKSLFY